MNNQNFTHQPSIEDLQDKLSRIKTHKEKKEVIKKIRFQVEDYQNKISELVQDLPTLRWLDVADFWINWNKVNDYIVWKQEKFDNTSIHDCISSDIKTLPSKNFVQKYCNYMPMWNVDVFYDYKGIKIRFYNVIDFKNVYSHCWHTIMERIALFTYANKLWWFFYSNNKYNIVGLNISGEWYIDSLEDHEDQHAKYSIIWEQWVNKVQSEKILNFKDSHPSLESEMIDFMRPHLNNAIIKSKDEIIAYTVDWRLTYDCLYQKWADTVYNFTYEEEQYLWEALKKSWYSQNQEDFDILCKRLFVNEYQRVLSNMIIIVKNNTDKIDLLSLVPLKQWHRLKWLKWSYSRTDFCMNLTKNLEQD